jgi:hypothetical protein
MKYLITESQLDKAIFKHLNNQYFIQVERGNNVYFINSENYEFAQINYDEYSRWCYINSDLINEISSFFSLERSDSEKVISRWVEYRLGMWVRFTLECGRDYSFRLRIPMDIQMRWRR